MTFSGVKHLNGCSRFYYKLWLLSDHDPCLNAAIGQTLFNLIYSCFPDDMWSEGLTAVLVDFVVVTNDATDVHMHAVNFSLCLMIYYM